MDKCIKTCVFLNGKPPTKKLLKEYVRDRDRIIAADGAYDYLVSMNIKPSVLIGDMDSVSRIPEDKDIQVLQMRDHDENDLEKTLNYCIKNDYRDIRVFGAAGLRLDHEIINIATLSAYSNLLNIEVITQNEYLCFLNPGEYGFKGKRGQRFSLLAIHTADEITLINARYPMTKDTLHKGSRGLSNAFKTNDLHICFKTGAVIFMTELKK